MSLLSQKTLSKKASISGVGVHTGNKVDLSILPSSPNSGIIFKRTDIKKNNIIIPHFSNVVDATLCTTISNEFGIKVSTIEHLMGAFFGLGIDNAVVELNSQEVPILDGSAKEFVKLIKYAGIIASDIPIKLIKVNNKIRFKKIVTDESVSKVSIIGVGMITTPGVTFRMFNALAKKNINIQVISTSEIKISVLVKQQNLKKAVDVLHKEFKLDY